MIRLRPAALVCATALLSSVLLARVHPFGNAGLYAANAPSSNTSNSRIMEHANVPPQVRDLLAAKCADCHSTQTRAPIYGRFAPVSWLMERDIIEGRKHLNLSVWDTYSPDEQQTLQAKIIQQAKSGKMPLPQYRNIHKGSAITPADLELLSRWNRQPILLPTAMPQPPVTPGDAVQGKLVFEKRCTGCHALDQNRDGPHLEGPRLNDVFGRAAGQVSNFAYSPALQNAHITWNEVTLDRWLTDPDAYLPGNNMDFRVIKQQERQDLIRFLKQSAEKQLQ